MDPVVIGRSVFSTANDTISGIAGNIQEMLCAVIDTILEVIKGIHFNVLPLNYLFSPTDHLHSSLNQHYY